MLLPSKKGTYWSFQEKCEAVIFVGSVVLHSLVSNGIGVSIGVTLAEMIDPA